MWEKWLLEIKSRMDVAYVTFLSSLQWLKSCLKGFNVTLLKVFFCWAERSLGQETVREENLLGRL